MRYKIGGRVWPTCHTSGTSGSLLPRSTAEFGKSLFLVQAARSRDVKPEWGNVTAALAVRT